jgi:putative phage-type endonuclease
MAYIKVVAQEQFEEWQDAHRTGIGASQIAAVLGEHRFASRLRVWAEKVGRLEPTDFSDNEAVQMGIELEPFVAAHYQRRTGRTLSQAGVLLRSILHPWAIATPDYWMMDELGYWAIPVQIKTTNAFRLNDWADGPPPEVWWQVQHEMLVTGAPWASVGVLVGGQRFMWADIVRDDGAMARIVREGAAFWDLVIHNTYPEPDTNSGEPLAALFPNAAEGEALALPQQAAEWDGELVALKGQKGTIEAEIARLENELKLAIGPAERGLLHDGSASYTYKNQQRWSYKLATGEPMPTESGTSVRAIATNAQFRVLRRTGGTE